MAAKSKNGLLEGIVTALPSPLRPTPHAPRSLRSCGLLWRAGRSWPLPRSVRPLWRGRAQQCCERPSSSDCWRAMWSCSSVGPLGIGRVSAVWLSGRVDGLGWEGDREDWEGVMFLESWKLDSCLTGGLRVPESFLGGEATGGCFDMFRAQLTCLRDRRTPVTLQLATVALQIADIALTTKCNKIHL